MVSVEQNEREGQHVHGVGRLEEAGALLEELAAPGVQNAVDFLRLPGQPEAFQVFPQRRLERESCIIATALLSNPRGERSTVTMSRVWVSSAPPVKSKEAVKHSSTRRQRSLFSPSRSPMIWRDSPGHMRRNLHVASTVQSEGLEG